MIRVILIVIIALTTLPGLSQNLKVGDKANGGIVAMVKKKHGLIVSEVHLVDLNWEQGKRACSEYRGGGFSDWRLPSRNEIEEIYYTLQSTGIVKFESCYYWSGTENTGIRSLAWSFDFNTGRAYNSHNKETLKRIIAVRSY